MLSLKTKIDRLLLLAWRRWVRTVTWWRRQNGRYGLWWRLANGLLAVLMLAGVVIPVVQQLAQADSYHLSADALKLVGQTDQKLVRQLTYDAKTQTYQFNKDAVKSTDSGPLAQLQNQVGAASGGKDKSLYALDVPSDMSKGVTYHDINSQLSFGLVPQFKAQNGKTEQGHLVFPLAGGTQAIYTLKNNGLKEDIVVPKATGDTMTFSYKLNLPKTLEAKIIPDSGGAIGIYSADPALFGNITYGSDKDQTAVQKARENGAKTTLVFGLPAPVIKAPDGGSVGRASASFELNGDQLSVVATGMSSLAGPVTIDPSVVVTSTSDFQTNANNEGMIDFSTSGQIGRGGLTGATAGAWTATASFTTGREYLGSAAYNGFLYILGGYTGTTRLNDVQYAAINSNGTIGTWAATTSFTTARNGLSAVAYNGYMYVLGGNDGTNKHNDVQYAPINANGTVGTWAATTSFTTQRTLQTAVTYNGYMYVIGGWNGTTYYNDVQYAPINANGTVGTWTATTSFTTARYGHTSVAYNGYMYVLGGYSGSENNDVQYAPINANGTTGTWASTTSFTTARDGHTSVVYNGYLYVTGGSGAAYYNDVQYAPINANGTVGAWAVTTNLAVNTFAHASIAYNGYLYTIGGADGISSYYTDVRYAQIDSAGMSGQFKTSTAMTAAGKGYGLAYNGYLYQFVSFTTSNTIATPVVYYAPLNADGTVGTWGTTTAYPTTRASYAVVAYNGFMYILGGNNGATYYSTVHYSAIAANGTLGTWTATTSFTTARSGLGAVAYNGFLYMTGGIDATVNYNDIQKGVIASNGTITSWASAGVAFTNGRGSLGVFVNGNKLYISGGRNVAASYYSDIQYTTISSTGTTGSWTTDTTTLPYGMMSFSPTVANGCVYIMQGWNGSFHGGLYYAPINSTGGLDAWQAVPSILGSIGNGQTVTSYQGYLYVYGGQISNTTGAGFTTADVEYAPINNGGTGETDSWSTGTSLSAARMGHGVAAYKGYLYVVGGLGTSNLNDVQYAPLNADGSIGSWTTSGNTFTNVREYLNVTVYNGYLYVLGGYSGATYYNDVQYAPINSNGNIGAFAATSSFTNGRWMPGVATYNGYMYVASGYDGSTNYNDVQYAAINANGTLGTWTATTSFTTARWGSRLVAYGGNLYIAGGYDGTNVLSDVQYAPINSNGTVGTWVPTTQFTGTRYEFTMTAYNGYLYILGGQDASVYHNDVQYAPINSDGTVGTWTTTTNFTTARANFGAAIYNGYLYIVGGAHTPPVSTVCNATSSAGCSDSQYTPLSSILRSGQYSKLIDLGGPENISSITYATAGGEPLPGGNAAITYKAADSSGVFSASGGSGAITSTTCTSSLNSMRYILVMITLDDSYGGGKGGAFVDSNGTNANLGAFTVNYVQGHPTSNIRMRLGQTLQTGVLSSLDTCI